MSENSGGPIVITCPDQKEAPLNLKYFSAAFFSRMNCAKGKTNTTSICLKHPTQPNISMIDIYKTNTLTLDKDKHMDSNKYIIKQKKQNKN